MVNNLIKSLNIICTEVSLMALWSFCTKYIPVDVLVCMLFFICSAAAGSAEGCDDRSWDADVIQGKWSSAINSLWWRSALIETFTQIVLRNWGTLYVQEKYYAMNVFELCVATLKVSLYCVFMSLSVLCVCVFVGVVTVTVWCLEWRCILTECDGDSRKIFKSTMFAHRVGSVLWSLWF